MLLLDGHFCVLHRNQENQFKLTLELTEGLQLHGNANDNRTVDTSIRDSEYKASGNF